MSESFSGLKSVQRVAWQIKISEWMAEYQVEGKWSGQTIIFWFSTVHKNSSGKCDSQKRAWSWGWKS